MARKVLEEKYATRAQEEIDSVKEYYARRLHDITGDDFVTKDMEDQAYYRELTNRSSSLEGTRTKELDKEKHRIRYDLVSGNGGLYYGQTQEPLNDEEATDDEEFEVGSENESVDFDNPYIINESEFSEERLDHDKLTLTYFAADDTLVDEDESIISNPDDIIGYENLDMKNTTVDNPHTIYVRNERLGADYEICIDLNSYQEVVLGIRPGLSPRQQQENRTKMRKEREEE